MGQNSLGQRAKQDILVGNKTYSVDLRWAHPPQTQIYGYVEGIPSSMSVGNTPNDVIDSVKAAIREWQRENLER